MAGREVAENDSPWLKNMLVTFYDETDPFQRSQVTSTCSTQNPVTSKFSSPDNNEVSDMPQEIH